MRHFKAQALRRLVLVICFCSSLASCTTRSYFVSDMAVETADEEREMLLARAKVLAPSAFSDKPTGEKELNLYSGKTLITGSWVHSSSDIEQLSVTLRDGIVTSVHRNIQMIEVRSFGCGNVSGHGSFCATAKYNQCETWGNHELRHYCPFVSYPRSARAISPEARHSIKRVAAEPTSVSRTDKDGASNSIADSPAQH